MENYDKLKDVKRAAGLLRISTDKTDHAGKKVDLEATLRNHKQKVTSFFEEKKWTYDLYEEVLSGGTEYEDRIELKNLLNNIEKYDAIVVMELQRLSRDTEVSGRIKSKVIKNQILIVTLNPFMIYDLANNPMEAMMYDMGSAVSEFERRVASARVKANKMSMARQGLNSSGSAAYGYFRNPATKKLEINEEQAKIVRMIYNWYLEGHGQRRICDMLNEMDILNNQGKRWCVQTIRALIERKTYKGTLVYNDHEVRKGKRVIVETIEYEGAHPPIIEPEVWEKAWALRENKRERYDDNNGRERAKRNLTILDGLLFCECCGRKTTIKFFTSHQEHYIRKCSQHNADGRTCDNGGFKYSYVEKAVFDKVMEYKNEIEEKIKKFKSSDFTDHRAELNELKEAYEKQLEQLSIKMRVIRKMETNYEMEKEVSGVSDPIEEEEIRNDKKENQQARLKLTEKLDEINQKLANNPKPEIELKSLYEKIEILDELEKRHETLEVSDINNLLKQIILKVHYRRKLPPEIEKLSTRNPIRSQYPADLKIDYIE
jgi:site-specific DNA recombinase